MPVSFDWEFKEEESDAPEEPGTNVAIVLRRRRWLVRAAVLFVLAAILGLGAWVWTRRRMEVVQRADAQLRDVVELELNTIADGDAELFRARQDPTDPRWETRQVVRYFTEPDSFTPAPGLAPADRPAEMEQVQMLGRTGRAELRHWFNAPPWGPGDPLPFLTTWFYRQDDDGIWYHVPPPDDYAGVPYSWYGSRLAIRATEVEAQVLDPVARDLANIVLTACLRLQCPEDVRYTLSFGEDLAATVQGDWWTLPALYLTGLPDGDEAHAVWERGIKLWVVEALVRAQFGIGELPDRLIYRHLVARLQADMGLFRGLAEDMLSPDLELLADALRNDRQHPLSTLWEAKIDSDDPEQMRLLESEVALLLDWIGDEVGDWRLLELLPALAEYPRLDTALLATYRLPPVEFEAEWFAHLSNVTGVTGPSGSNPEADTVALETPRASFLTGDRNRPRGGGGIL